MICPTRGIPSPPVENLLVPPPSRPYKNLPSRLSPTKYLFPLPPNLNAPPPLQKKKNITFSYSHWLLYYFCFNFRLFRHTGHANFDFKWCSVFTESFEKCSNCQNHSSSSIYPVKNPPSQQNFWSSPPSAGEFTPPSPYPLLLFRKPWYM